MRGRATISIISPIQPSIAGRNVSLRAPGPSIGGGGSTPTKQKNLKTTTKQTTTTAEAKPKAKPPSKKKKKKQGGITFSDSDDDDEDEEDMIDLLSSSDDTSEDDEPIAKKKVPISSRPARQVVSESKKTKHKHINQFSSYLLVLARSLRNFCKPNTAEVLPTNIGDF